MYERRGSPPPNNNKIVLPVAQSGSWSGDAIALFPVQEIVRRADKFVCGA